MSNVNKALVIGIDYYEHFGNLGGCVNDAFAVKNALERHASDGTKNFDVKALTAGSEETAVSRRDLKSHIEELFKGKGDTALLYFAGHGYIESTGGYLCSSDINSGDEGISLADVITFSNNSEIGNRVIILDCCHSGIVAHVPGKKDYSELKEGTTILTASTSEQPSKEEDGGGVFTNLLVDALSGAAANLLGEVTPGSIYAHIDQSLGPWDQRPVFKTNVESFVSLRKTHSPVSLSDLHQLLEFFPTAGEVFPLDPTFEPERSASDTELPDPIEANVSKFKILQKLNRVNLIIPHDAPHMWHAAMESKGCKLTILGEHYRRLVEKNYI